MTKLNLSPEDLGMLAGKNGQAAQLAMSVIVKMAEIECADSLINITRAHIDSSIYTGDASLQFAEKLAGMGATVRVPSTLNVSSIDEFGWEQWNVPSSYAGKAKRQMEAYLQMGCSPVWTCAPYQNNGRPELGEPIAWSESNAVVFANSVIGARTARFPGFLDICVAITGRAPHSGLYLTENRAAQMHINLDLVPMALQRSEAFFPILGYWMGKACQDMIPVLDHLKVQPDEDQLKAFGAAAASSGGVAMFHIVGITPEAPSLEAALQGKAAAREHRLTEEEIMDAYTQLNTTSDQRLDVVFMGCPHFSVEEFEQLAEFTAGRTCHPDVLFLVTTSRKVRAEIERLGILAKMQAFGVKITQDTCILISPILSKQQKVMMTSSGKCAYYAPGQLQVGVHFGSVSECVNSAVHGLVHKENFTWKN